MKKAIFTAIFVSLILLPTAPVVVNAQTFSAEQQATLDSLNQNLIILLTQLIAQLQAQIAELIAQQATQATQIGAVQSQVNTVVAQTAPRVTPTPPIISVSYGIPICQHEPRTFGSATPGGPDVQRMEDEISIPVTISTKNGWRYGHTIRSTDGVSFSGGAGFDTGSTNILVYSTYYDRVAPTSVFLKTELTNTKPQQPFYSVVDPIFSDTQEVVIPICQ